MQGKTALTRTFIICTFLLILRYIAHIWSKIETRKTGENSIKIVCKGMDRFQEADDMVQMQAFAETVMNFRNHKIGVS